MRLGLGRPWPDGEKIWQVIRSANTRSTDGKYRNFTVDSRKANIAGHLPPAYPVVPGRRASMSIKRKNGTSQQISDRSAPPAGSHTLQKRKQRRTNIQLLATTLAGASRDLHVCLYGTVPACKTCSFQNPAGLGLGKRWEAISDALRPVSQPVRRCLERVSGTLPTPLPHSDYVLTCLLGDHRLACAHPSRF